MHPSTYVVTIVATIHLAAGPALVVVERIGVRPGCNCARVAGNWGHLGAHNAVVDSILNVRERRLGVAIALPVGFRVRGLCGFTVREVRMLGVTGEAQSQACILVGPGGWVGRGRGADAPAT